LEQIAQQADRQIRHGFELAGRGAHFAARSEFIGALRLVAEGLDTEQKSNVHGRALAAALGAMKEAEDFLPGGSRLDGDSDLPGIVAGHVTPVLKNSTEKVTSMTALRGYLSFAQEQFAAAAGREVAGSMALHAMGKLHAALAQKRDAAIAVPESKAMVFFQAALLVYPKNHMAANDLGVLLAQCGRYADARAMLERSVALCPQSTGWQNLTVVYRQLGQTALAERAAGQARLFQQAEIARRQTSPVAAKGTVQWVDSQGFARTSTNLPNWPASTPASASRIPRGTPVYQR
jgi:tetratricopeptide (TPR) repeat protein